MSPETSTALAAPLAIGEAGAGVALWLCPLEGRDEEIDALARTLSPTELARAGRFGTARLRKRWITGRATLRRLVGNALGVDPASVAIHRGVRGRPQLTAAYGLDFNISHTEDVALIAIAGGLPAGSRIGVDIERRDRVVNADRLARKFMADAERAAMTPLDGDSRRLHFLALWTCKEAMSKATGDALSAPFREIEVALDGGPRLVAGPPPYVPEGWRLVRPAVPAAFIATVAIWRGS